VAGYFSLRRDGLLFERILPVCEPAADAEEDQTE